MSLHDALTWIVRLFEEKGVPYQLVGGLAARAYGATRPIVDVDFYVSADGFERIEPDLEPYFLRPPSRYEDEDWSLTFSRVEYAGQAIELGIAEGAKFKDHSRGTWEDAAIDFDAGVRKELFGVELQVMPRSQLISYKEKLGREVDRQDLNEMGA